MDSDALVPPFLVSRADLADSPSRRDGVDEATELRFLRYGCSIAQQAAVQLHLPQEVAVTAQILLHRFFTRRSLAQFEVELTATACLWLACKLEEAIEIDDPKKLRFRDVLAVCERVCTRKSWEAAGWETAGREPEDGRGAAPRLPLLDPYSARYESIKSGVVRAERHVLRALGFIAHCEAPHRAVLNYGAIALGLSREGLQAAWDCCNDACRTRLVVLLRPESLAAGCLFVAARRLGLSLPENPPWWEALDVPGTDILEVAHSLEELRALGREPPYDPVCAGVGGGPGIDRVAAPFPAAAKRPVRRREVGREPPRACEPRGPSRHLRAAGSEDQ